MSIRVTSRKSDDFREANYNVEFGVELNNVDIVLVRQGLRQLDQDEFFVQNFLKVNFQQFFLLSSVFFSQ